MDRDRPCLSLSKWSPLQQAPPEYVCVIEKRSSLYSLYHFFSDTIYMNLLISLINNGQTLLKNLSWRIQVGKMSLTFEWIITTSSFLTKTLSCGRRVTSGRSDYFAPWTFHNQVKGQRFEIPPRSLNPIESKAVILWGWYRALYYRWESTWIQYHQFWYKFWRSTITKSLPHLNQSKSLRATSDHIIPFYLLLTMDFDQCLRCGEQWRYKTYVELFRVS